VTNLLVTSAYFLKLLLMM